jgi:ABC-type maltose transport system permease subunit
MPSTAWTSKADQRAARTVSGRMPAGPTARPVLSNPKLMTIPVGLATVQGSFGQRLSDIQATSILGALPLVILFLIFQRRIVEGVAGSGLKG